MPNDMNTSVVLSNQCLIKYTLLVYKSRMLYCTVCYYLSIFFLVFTCMLGLATRILHQA